MRFMGSATSLGIPPVNAELLAQIRAAQAIPVDAEDRARAVAFLREVSPAVRDETVELVIDVLEEGHPAARALKWKRIGLGAGVAAAAGVSVYALSKLMKKRGRR